MLLGCTSKRVCGNISLNFSGVGKSLVQSVQSFLLHVVLTHDILVFAVRYSRLHVTWLSGVIVSILA
jgi:hypothetical protein